MKTAKIFFFQKLFYIYLFYRKKINVNKCLKVINLKYSNATLNNGSPVQYLFAVALTFLSSSNRIKCRNKVYRTISKIFTTCNRRLVYTQRVGIFKYRVALTTGKRKTFINLMNDNLQ
jgi:hypothetical protein